MKEFVFDELSMKELICLICCYNLSDSLLAFNFAYVFIEDSLYFISLTYLWFPVGISNTIRREASLY